MLLIFACGIALVSSCNHEEMVKKMVGDHKEDLASPSEVTSLGRDDDDGQAKKWHIGGGKN